MRGGRAGALAQARKKAVNAGGYTQSDALKSYGLKVNNHKAMYDQNDIQMLQKYKAQPNPSREQNPMGTPQKNPNDKFYDHFADIEAAKSKMNDDQRQSDLTDGLQRNTEAGIDQDKQFDQEFDDIRRDKKNFHPYHGELVLNKKYLTKDDEEQALSAINCKEASDTRLIFKRLPCMIWFAGAVIILAGIYLIYHLSLGHFGVLFNGYREGHWWQYLVSILMICFGVFFMYAGKIEQVILDKEQGLMSKVKTNIFCQKTQSDWALEQMRNIRVFKRGHDGIQVMTIHYEVQIDFSDIPSHVILKTQQKDKAIQQMARLKEFMGMPINRSDLKFIDESTTKYKK